MYSLGVRMIPPRHEWVAILRVSHSGGRISLWKQYLPVVVVEGVAPLCKVNFCALQLAFVPKRQDDLDYFYRMNTRLDEMGLEFNFQWNSVLNCLRLFSSLQQQHQCRLFLIGGCCCSAVQGQAIHFSNKMERNPIECRQHSSSK